MAQVNQQAVKVALDRLFNRRAGGGPRSQVYRRVKGEALVKLCESIADPTIEARQTFNELAVQLGDRCPGRSALYNFSAAFTKEYVKARNELDGVDVSPSLAAIPLLEVARRLCVREADVQVLVTAGRLRTIDAAGHLRVPIDSLAAFIGGKA